VTEKENPLSTKLSSHVCTPGCQGFHHGRIGVTWCVSLALELLADKPELGTPLTADISGMDPFIGLTEPTPGHVQLYAHEGIDKEYAATVDLSAPLLVVRLVNIRGEDHGPQIVDGWHRVYRARTLGMTELPAILLSPEAELAARVADRWCVLRRG
jgi:hypothetical protein